MCYVLFCLLIVDSVSISSEYLFFFVNDTATPEIYTLSLHDALPSTEQEEVEESRPKIKQKSHKPANLMKKRSNILEKVKPKPSKPASIQTQKPKDRKAHV